MQRTTVSEINESVYKDFGCYDHHKAVYRVENPKADLFGFIAIHRGNADYPALGATRVWNYIQEKDALKDVLRLSRGMSYKAAVAKLQYGGGKAVLISKRRKKPDKERLLVAYADAVKQLGGDFVTGADVGITKADVAYMRKLTPYFIGTKVDPVKYTALGVFVSIQTVLKGLYGDESVAGKTFAIQGVGKIGMKLLEILYTEGADCIIADIDTQRVKLAKRKFPNLQYVSPSEVIKQKVDVFSPCALSGCISWEVLGKLRCKSIVGGANSQLEDANIGKELYNKDILYAPDYVVNSGGLISVVDEFENKTGDNGSILSKVYRIGDTLQDIIQVSKKNRIPTNMVADKMAEKIFNGFDE